MKGFEKKLDDDITKQMIKEMNRPNTKVFTKWERTTDRCRPDPAAERRCGLDASDKAGQNANAEASSSKPPDAGDA